MAVAGSYYVYILTNQNNRVMYVGVTNNITHRIYQHRHKLIKGFTEKYNIIKLVYFEETADILAALRSQKQVKKWRREKKDTLVSGMNPDWRDLAEDWF